MSNTTIREACRKGMQLEGGEHGDRDARELIGELARHGKKALDNDTET